LLNGNGNGGIVISNVDFLFGTDGAPIPEPSSQLLFGAGVLIVGFALRGRLVMK
jgi:hypothetical protein